MWRLVQLVDRSVLRISGDAGSQLLQGLCTQDMSILSKQKAAAAAFLSVKGRVLCDTVMVSQGDSIFIDCHHTVSQSLLKLLTRHKLRLPITLEDVSNSYRVLAALPAGSQIGNATSLPATCNDAFFADPRYAELGQRAVVPADVLNEVDKDDGAYHLWRLCCAVPEGPRDLPVDSALPLNGNLDLLNFISFSKGCYVGQELTARSKHVGTVRRRMYSVVACDAGVLEALSAADITKPLPLAAVHEGLVLPESSGGAEKGVPVELGNGSKPLGHMASAMHNVGLCTVRSEGALQSPDDFRRPLVAPETKLTAGGIAVSLRPPPYAFTTSVE
mmetsp:Transcript_42523/g.95594  ORF Transcript_42523/g.95594 Transcript_42523/m.95594 type:complete len:331 (-) Transcript_42523:8-1000(-)